MTAPPRRGLFAFRSIRQRVFAAILLPATTLLAISLLLVFLQVRADRLADLDRELQARTLAIVGMTEHGRSGWSLEIDFQRESESDLLRPLVDWRLQVYPCGEVLAQSKGPLHGECRSSDFDTDAIPPLEKRPAMVSGAASSTDGEAGRLRRWSGVYVVRGDVDGDEAFPAADVTALHPPGLLHASASQNLNPLEAGLRRLVGRLALLGGLLLALAAILAHLLARGIASPLENMVTRIASVVEPGAEPVLEIDGGGVEIEKLAETMNAAFLRSHAAVEQQKRFAADASHELRTPLSALRTACEVTLSRERASGEYRSTVEDTLVSALRLQKIVEGLLLLARSDTQRPLKTARLEFSAFVSDVVDDLPEADQARVHVTALDECWIDVDEVLVEQALRNLIDNALVHGGADGDVFVEVTMGPTDFVIVVRDTGPGIGAEHLAFVFDRFYRTDESRVRTRGGAGLGLSITRAIVERHGGDIAVQSKDGAGATFTIRLPLEPMI